MPQSFGIPNLVLFSHQHSIVLGLSKSRNLPQNSKKSTRNGWNCWKWSPSSDPATTRCYQRDCSFGQACPVIKASIRLPSTNWRFSLLGKSSNSMVDFPAGHVWSPEGKDDMIQAKTKSQVKYVACSSLLKVECLIPVCPEQLKSIHPVCSTSDFFIIRAWPRIGV